MLGHIVISSAEPDKNQACLAVGSVFHPNSMITIVLIKVKPEIQITLFVDYQQLRFNTNQDVNEDCEVMYWSQVKTSEKKNFFFDYELVNEVPCRYDVCHYSADGSCPVEHAVLVDVSATIVCHSHIMGFAEFGRDGQPEVMYHKITQDIIEWLMSLTIEEV
ncbi:uncharacterized protein LOC126838967 [Adelges cooleyi]|uniref:uncharacterized protein LOC126838967 n=1 Tax=Adelges cooleyi TaxID=133065 RepID=UPI0021806054|nr:uncharacterized protein LOC126838967 [Adelges cooleyi]